MQGPPKKEFDETYGMRSMIEREVKEGEPEVKQLDSNKWRCEEKNIALQAADEMYSRFVYEVRSPDPRDSGN